MPCSVPCLGLGASPFFCYLSCGDLWHFYCWRTECLRAARMEKLSKQVGPRYQDTLVKGLRNILALKGIIGLLLTNGCVNAPKSVSSIPTPPSRAEVSYGLTPVITSIHYLHSLIVLGIRGYFGSSISAMVVNLQSSSSSSRTHIYGYGGNRWHHLHGFGNLC